jgi:carboxypeptidase family protein
MGTQVSFGVNLGEKGCDLMKSSASIINSGAQSTMIKKTLQVLGVMFGVLLLCLPVFSQGSSGRIVGTITDANGGAITGATVTILDVQRGTSRPLTTDESGAYNAPNLTPGAYKVRAEFKGFKTTERQNIVLEVGQELRVDLSLQPGEQAQTITVTEQVPLVETTNAELGGTLQNEVINDLPLNGRNFENLLDLRPGVTKYVGNSGWTQSSNGLRPHDNFFMVDGINSNDPWMAQSVMNAVMAAGDAGTMLPIDAIDEFKTQQNPRAEYGWKPGAVVNVGVKSGTNSIHGSAYAYGRSTGFNARNYFNVDIKGNPGCATDPLPCTKTPVELEQYGASVGGPIKKDKLFYFGNFEAQRYAVGNPTPHDIPITSATSTDPGSLVTACKAAGASLSALSAQLAGLDMTCTPLSNYPGLFPVNNTNSTVLNTSLNSQNRIYSGVGKIDYHINEKHSLNGMYFISPGSGTFVDDPGKQINPLWLTVQYARSQVGSVGWTYVPNSKWVNSFRFGYSHYYQTFTAGDAGQDPANYSFNGSTYHFYTGQADKTYFGFPRLRIGDFPNFQLGASWPKTVGPDSVWQFSDSISYLRGNHSFKFGGEVLVNQSTNNVTSNTKGPLQFVTLDDYFIGNIQKANISAGNFLRHLQSEGYALFVQDDWRVTPRLTVNIGVRYELNTVVKEKNNLIGNFDPVKGLQQVGVGGVSSPFNGDHNNFGPRFGFAWDIAGNGKTVVRGGGSVLYEQGSFDAMNALGNLLGLRTIPTGVKLYTCPTGDDPCTGTTAVTTAGGTINLGAVSFSKSGLGAANKPGTLLSNWANNSSTTPLYAASPACGDGNGTNPQVLPTPQPCSILGVDRNLRTPYITTWSLGIQRALTNNLSLDVTYVGNHATKLVGLIDLNQPLLGSGWGNPATAGTPAAVCLGSANDSTVDPVTLLSVSTPYDKCGVPNPVTKKNKFGADGGLEVAAQPFVGKFPYLGYIHWLSNTDFSNYNSLQVSMTQRAVHGLSFVMGYTFAHALGESPDNWSFISATDNKNTRSIYGTTEFDVTHRFTFSTTYAIPGMKTPGQLLEGWSLNSIVTLESATPWGVNDVTTDFSGTNEIGSQSPNGEQWDFFGNPVDFKTTKAFSSTNGGAGGIPYFAGGGPTSAPSSNSACNTKAAAIGPLAVAALSNLGCYANGNSILLPPAYGTVGNTSPNMFRSLPYYNVDLSVTKVFKYKERLTAQFRAEFFNLFNRPNISNPYGGPGGDNSLTDPSAVAGASFGYRALTPDVLSSNPVLGSGGARAMQLGLKILF